MGLHRIQRVRVAGYSLLEALTVLVVMAIITSFAVVVYGSYRRAARARSAAQQFEALFGTARTLAINQNAHFQAVLDLGNSGLWIDQVDSLGQVITPKITTPEAWSAYVHPVELFINGLPYPTGLARIQFHPNGTSDAARIVLLSEGADSRSTGELLTVKLFSSTARTRTYPGNRP